MKSNSFVLLGLYGLLIWTTLDCPSAVAQADEDDDFDDGVVAEEVDTTESEAIDYTSPIATPSKYYFAEHFDDPEKFKQKWILSQAKKDGADEQIAKYDGEWQVEAPQQPILKGDLGLVLKSKVKHAAIAARLNRPFVFVDKPFIVQYEVTMQEGQECGGAYIKLLSSGKESADLKQFHDKTPYTIMFGPDKCGNDHKLHFIFRHKNPKNGSLEEKHCKKPTDRLEEPFKDKRPHLYTLLLRPDNSFSVLLDHKEINSGSLLEDFTPAVNPPEEIDDPNDIKPADWDDRERISDPSASKPIDWDETAPPQIPDPQAVKPEGWLDDEPEMIPDPTGEKPEDWDVDMDGEWEAPLVENPKCAGAPGCGRWSAPLITNANYKGVWRAPLVVNPQYQGKWAPKKIRNPLYFKDDNPYKMTSIAAVGIELWSMSPALLFDNIVITDDVDAALSWSQQTFDLKVNKLDRDSVSIWGRIMKALNYKPGWWALYFVYCSIPVTIYVWYLRKRVQEDSAWSWLVKTTDQNPWLWAVYVLVVALLTGLFIFMCCVSSTPEKDELEKEAEAKKTDELTEDQPQAEEEEESSPENDEGSQDEEEEEDSQSNSKQSLDESLPEVEVKTSDADGAGAGDMPRKRKPRKE